MTKNDFMLEVALRLITARPDLSMGEIADLASDLAGEFFHEEDQPEPETPYINEPISVVIKEIDRIDIEERDKKNEDARALGHRWSYSKCGHAAIVRTACNRESIETVAGLLAFGRDNFLGIYNVGKKVLVSVDKALENLYDIKNW